MIKKMKKIESVKETNKDEEAMEHQPIAALYAFEKNTKFKLGFPQQSTIQQRKAIVKIIQKCAELETKVLDELIAKEEKGE